MRFNCCLHGDHIAGLLSSRKLKFKTESQKLTNILYFGEIISTLFLFYHIYIYIHTHHLKILTL